MLTSDTKLNLVNNSIWNLDRCPDDCEFLESVETPWPQELRGNYRMRSCTLLQNELDAEMCPRWGEAIAEYQEHLRDIAQDA